MTVNENSVEQDNVKIVFDEKNIRCAALDGEKETGFITIEPGADNLWTITHTEVDSAYGGRGIAKKLVLKVVEEARARSVKIIPVCSYAKKILEGNEEYSDVL